MKILIVVDMQNDFVTGSLGSEQAKAIVPNVIKKLDNANENYDMVIFTQDEHDHNYLETQEGRKLPVKHCIQGTIGHELIADILNHEIFKSSNKSYVVHKETFGFRYWCENLDNIISLYCRNNEIDDITEIELIGLCTDICVVTNALLLKTLFPEVEITVDASCCAGVTEESHKAALLTMKMCQINIINEV